MKEEAKKTICIDLDGVLNEYKGIYNGEHIPNPINGAEKFLKKLNKEFNLILFTARDIKLTLKWLEKHNLSKYIIEVTNIKKPCFLYIDDRAICHRGNFKETIKEIEKFEVYWQNQKTC